MQGFSREGQGYPRLQPTAHIGTSPRRTPPLSPCVCQPHVPLPHITTLMGAAWTPEFTRVLKHLCCFGCRYLNRHKYKPWGPHGVSVSRQLLALKTLLWVHLTCYPHPRLVGNILWGFCSPSLASPQARTPRGLRLPRCSDGGEHLQACPLHTCEDRPRAASITRGPGALAALPQVCPPRTQRPPFPHLPGEGQGISGPGRGGVGG